MATLAEEIAEARLLLGEPIPEGGTESDTLITDAQLTDWITDLPSLNAVLLRGWEVKRAHFASLVNVVDGASSREFEVLFERASQMVKTYSIAAEGPRSGRARVGRIVRSR